MHRTSAAGWKIRISVIPTLGSTLQKYSLGGFYQEWWRIAIGWRRCRRFSILFIES